MKNFINDNRGFMMAELIIVSAIIITTLVALYASFSKMYSNYAERGYYLDVDGKYILKTIYDDLIDNNNFVLLINGDAGLKESSDEKRRYVNVIKDNNCLFLSSDLCNFLKNNYNVQTVVFGRYDENVFTNVNVEGNNNVQDNILSDTSYNGEFRTYFKYLGNTIDFNDKYEYIFIIEYKNGDDVYYSNYLVR